MPKGWTSGTQGIPDLSYPTEVELKAGYEGESWTGTNGAWTLEIMWRGDHAKYLCRALCRDERENPQESRTFNYPHEVVEWLEKWFTHLGRAEH